MSSTAAAPARAPQTCGARFLPHLTLPPRSQRSALTLRRRRPGDHLVICCGRLCSRADRVRVTAALSPSVGSRTHSASRHPQPSVSHSAPALSQRPSQRQPARASPGGAASTSATRLQTVLNAIDQINSEDTRTARVGGQDVPYELAYSRWVTEWMCKLKPDASEEVQIAGRGQHVARWRSPRSSYPEGRAAYLQWREQLKKMHAGIVADIMRDAGYNEDSIERTRLIMLKKNLKDPDTQVVEDALCLVFLQYQFEEFRKKETDEKMVEILRKSWRKMSPSGHQAALTLQLGSKEAELVGKALQA